MRSRYFKNAQARKPVFQWTGNPVSPKALTDKEFKLGITPNPQLHYQSFRLGQLDVSVGEHVLVRNMDCSDSLMDCDVVLVEGLYQDFNNASDPYRAKVKWLCRPDFAPGNLKNGHGLEEQGVPPLDNEHEVVGEAREYDRDISAESIYYKCKVLQGGIHQNPKAFWEEHNEGIYPYYLHRFNLKVSDAKKSKKTYVWEPLLSNPEISRQINPPEMKIKTPPKELKQNRKRILSESSETGNTQEFQLKMTPKKRRMSLGGPLLAASPQSLRVDVKNILQPRTRRASAGSSRASSRASDISLELSSFVTSTVESNGSSVKSTLNGGYWDSQEGKRTPKPTNRLVESSVTKKSGVKEKLVESELATNSGRKLKIKFGTQMETATGSGRKVTLKCSRTKKSEPSSGLKSSHIESLLDSDPEESPVKKTQVTRTRRASVSCTTPRRSAMIKDLAVTPNKSQTKKRPASEVKKRPASEVKGTQRRSLKPIVKDDSDDDFIPITKKERVKKKLPIKSQQSSSSESEESEEESDESEASEESEDDTPVKKKTASKSKTTSIKTPKRVFKPSVAPRSKPLPSDVDPLTEAQQRLHVSAVPDSLPCREEEFAEILGYVASKLEEGRGGCYYISGVPGTGKTATVMEVIRYLQENKEDYPEFNFHALNGMRLTSPEQAYVEMWKQLTGDKATAEHAMKLLAARFSKAAPKRATTIFLVDELDMLCNRKQSVLYNIFDWPSKPEGKLIIIAIANTMDLPERVMINRVSSRLGLTRQTFQPYTHEQLQEIVASRLEGLQIFEPNAVQLVARKVASLSGDARRALDICRRATEMAESAGLAKISLKHVTGAYQEMFTSPKIQAIRSCSKYEQLLLQVLASEFRRTGVEESSLGPVFREFTNRLRTEGLEVLSLPGVVAVVARLAAMRLLLAEHFRQGLETKLRLNVASDDINFALKQIEED